MEIADWRCRIDKLDEEIVRLISERAQAAKAIGELKKEAGLPIYEPSRENVVFDRVKQINPGPLPDSELQHIYERIIDVMRGLQRQ
jgi:chorismate mutase